MLFRSLKKTNKYIESMILQRSAKEVMDLIKSQEQIIILQMNEITIGLMEHIDNQKDPNLRRLAAELAQEMMERKIAMIDSHSNLIKLLTGAEERDQLPGELGGNFPVRQEVSADDWMKNFEQPVVEKKSE